MIKTLIKQEPKGFSQLDKEHLQKPTDNITLNSEKPSAFPFRSGTWQGCPPHTLIQYSAGHSGQHNMARKRN